MKYFKLVCLYVTSFYMAVSVMAQERALQIYQGDEIMQSYNVSEIDSIKINSILSAPMGVNAALEGETVVVSWEEVQGATSYEVYKSYDNISYSVLATDIVETLYVDDSPFEGSNYYKVKAVGESLSSALSFASQCVMYVSENTMESGLYMGIIGFNQSLETKPVSVLNQDTEGPFKSFVNKMTTKDGTILYYAVENAIDQLETTQLPDDLFHVAIVTFTDGLDMGSLMLNPDYLTKNEYLDAIAKRIKTETIRGVPISAYSIGIRGDDVTDIYEFRANLQGLASSPENAAEVTTMDDVNERFQAIADQLNQTSYVQTISLKIPGQAHGTKIRFTFDEVSDASVSDLYIEGIFDLRNRSLTDITYHGLSSTSGTTVSGQVDGIFVTFTFEGVQSDNNEIIPQDNTQQWSYVETAAKWQINSEFTPDGNTEAVVSKKSAAIILVLDCSKSLSSQFADLQEKANSFIDKIASHTSLPESQIPGDLYESFEGTQWNMDYSYCQSGGNTWMSMSDVCTAEITNERINGKRVIKMITKSGQTYYFLYSFDETTQVSTLELKLGETAFTYLSSGVTYNIVPAVITLDSYEVATTAPMIAGTFDLRSRSFPLNMGNYLLVHVAQNNMSQVYSRLGIRKDFKFMRID